MGIVQLAGSGRGRPALVRLRVVAAAVGYLGLAIAASAQQSGPGQTPPSEPPASSAQPPAQAQPQAPLTGISAVQNLAGRWRGKGYIEVNGGSREEIQCIAVYVLKESSKTIEQNLRCASSSYKVDAQANLKVTGERVSGTWEEKSYSSSGTVSGQVKTGGFNLFIKGDSFTARMSVASGKSTQTLNITPQGLSVTKIQVGLSRT